MAGRRRGDAARKVGVLLTNLGSPEAPTPAAVRRYLAEFLWDKRVVELPRPLWWLILNLIVLRIRPARSAAAYRKIWLDEGAPLKVFTARLAEIIRDRLNLSTNAVFYVEPAMRYGKPAISEALRHLREAGVEKIVVLPLYPQYSAATTASVYDAVTESLSSWRHIPGLCFISDYHRKPRYIQGIADSIADFWKENGKPQHLLFSFHGLPERTRALGDPYYDQCLASAADIADALSLSENDWQVVFQSRFGRAQWLKPYCVDVLAELPTLGISRVDVVCPGFAVDCLETLEEIAIANRALYLEAGGQEYRYIPALNTEEVQVSLMMDLILEHLSGAASASVRLPQSSPQGR